MGAVDINDEQLVARMVQGEVAAFETLYDRYAPIVMGLALRILADRALAEEVVQETFWRAWRNAASFQEQRGAFAGWLLGIARNQAIDFCRRRRVRPQVLTDEADESPLEQLPDRSADVAEAAWTAIKNQQVYAALSDLPHDQRRVIELAYFGGLTRQEIAARTGEPLGTIHSRARLALKKLRAALLAQGFED